MRELSPLPRPIPYAGVLLVRPEGVCDGWPIRPDELVHGLGYAFELPAGQGTLVLGKWLNCVPCCACGNSGCNNQRGNKTELQWTGLMNKVGSKSWGDGR